MHGRWESHLHDFLEKNIATVPVNGATLKVCTDTNCRNGVEHPTDVGPINVLAVDTLSSRVAATTDKATPLPLDNALGSWSKYRLDRELAVAGYDGPTGWSRPFATT